MPMPSKPVPIIQLLTQKPAAKSTPGWRDPARTVAMSDFLQPKAREPVRPVDAELKRKKAEKQTMVRDRRAEQAIKDKTFDVYDTDEEKK